MLVSALCIVKNEAANLPRWLEEMQKVADELIVVDTGSTDNSVELASQGGANVYYFQWQDDFSAARNFALAKARGDIIIFLDADEYFPKQSLSKIRLIASELKAQKQVVGICSPRIEIDVENEQNQFIDVNNQCRLFRRGCTYRGSIHETLEIPNGMNFVQDDRLLFYHTGYSASLIKEKLKRNLQMLRARCEFPNYKITPMDYRYFMDCYFGLGDYDKAFSMSTMCLEHKEKLGTELSYIYKIRVKSAYFSGASPQMVKELLREARENAPDKTYFLQLTGHYLWEIGEREQALAYIESGLTATTDKSPKTPVYELLPYSYLIWGESLIAKGEWEQGLIILQQAAKEFTHVPLLKKSLTNAQLYCNVVCSDDRRKNE